MGKEVNLPKPQIQNIPAEAYKKVVCECGCDIFQQAHALFQYPGGIWHAKPVTNPMPIMVCWQCGRPYIDKKAKFVDLKEEKA